MEGGIQRWMSFGKGLEITSGRVTAAGKGHPEMLSFLYPASGAAAGMLFYIAKVHFIYHYWHSVV